MTIYTVTEKDFDLFSDFIPADILGHMGRVGYYSIGVFNEIMHMMPVGFAQFYAGFPTQEEEMPEYFLLYLYIKEEARYEGAGSKLLDEIQWIAKKSGVPQIRVRCLTQGVVTNYFSPDTEELVKFLQKHGFSFEEQEYYLLGRSLSAFWALDFVRGIPYKCVKALSEVRPDEWNFIVSKLGAEAKASVLQALENNKWQRYDFDLSCVYKTDKGIQGYMLIRRLVSGGYGMERLRSFHQKEPMVLLSMLAFLDAKTKEKCSANQFIAMEAHNVMAQKLFQKIFPEYQPEKCLMGIWKPGAVSQGEEE